MKPFNSFTSSFLKLFKSKNNNEKSVIEEVPVVVKKTRFEKRNDFYENFFERSKEDKVMLIKEDHDKIFTFHFGYIVGSSYDQYGVCCPMVKDELTGEILEFGCKMMDFNERVVHYMKRLNKGQFLALFKMSNVEIDEEMKTIAELNEMFIIDETIERLKDIGFYQVENESVEIVYSPNYWGSQMNFYYNSPYSKPKAIADDIEDKEGYKLKLCEKYSEEKTLTMYISNENETPTLSVFKGVEFVRDHVFTIWTCLKDGSERSPFGMPHVYSDTLRSAFEPIGKAILHAILYGNEKPDNQIYIKDGVVYKTYKVFKNEIEEQKKQYEKIIEKSE